VVPDDRFSLVAAGLDWPPKRPVLPNLTLTFGAWFDPHTSDAATRGHFPRTRNLPWKVRSLVEEAESAWNPAGHWAILGPLTSPNACC